jgi:transmembrane protein TMEM260 (protein O-mannosyltransferase)
MQFKRVNNIAGWIVFAIACTVFIITREATVSFWDCGEFIPCADKLQISHPPGAPLFVLLGRIFIILFGGGWNGALPNPHAAVQVNLLSATSSAFTVLFLFWTITHIGKKLLVKNNETINLEKTIAIIGAGIVGALAFAFSDSFWFSAVEGIVFGVSPLFIALIFWSILKWEDQADEKGADRWLVLIAYLVGLSVGVHLLSLLSIPAVVLTYYFRRYKYSFKGLVLAFLLACVLTGIVQILIIQDTVKLIGWFELYFTNDLGLPFNSGSYFCLALFAAIIFFGVRWGIKKGKYFLQLGLICFAFILVGYSSYFITLIRANADTSVNMQDVNNPIELVNYLDRSQYGTWPIFMGPYFTAKHLQKPKIEGDIYYKNEETGKYEVVGKKMDYDYNPDDIHFFPRVWDGIDAGHVKCYKDWLNLADGDEPSIANNLDWLFSYQFNWMYWRYLMWNFSGRQNDLQGMGNVRDGNWITGIPILDNIRLGDQSKLPDSLKQNDARTALFMLPFMLALLGIAFQWKKDKKNLVVVFLLFFFTGIGIILYLNQTGPQPRERDYSYVGSFYAFAIWIGLGVLFVYDMLKQKLSGNVAALVASGACLLAVPIWMCKQEWKAHDRSMKTLARDSAKDYLNSCPPNAILFTAADNDTYPLWYAQEVENVRPDVRVIITTLLGTDWDINQLRRKINESDPINISWAKEKYLGDNRDQVWYVDGNPAFSKDGFYNLNDIMAFIADDNNKLLAENDDSVSYFPTHNFYIPVNKEEVLHNGTVAAKDSASILPQVNFTFSGNYMSRNDMMELNIIAANNWQRPICFTDPSTPGLNSFLKQEGLVYRLEPVAADPNNNVNIDTMYNNLMNKFKFGGAEKPNVYFDENSRRILQEMRKAFTDLAKALALEGKKDSALRVLNYCDKMINPSTFLYGMVSSFNQSQDGASIDYCYAYYLAGDNKKADTIANTIIKDCQQQLDYYTSLPPDMQASFAQDEQIVSSIIKELQDLNKQFNTASPAYKP